MLATLNRDLLGLIFDELDYADVLALRATCHSLRQYHRYRCSLVAKEMQKSYRRYRHTSLEELTSFVMGRLCFNPNEVFQNNLVQRTTNVLSSFHSAFTSVDIGATLQQVLMKALHPPHIPIKFVCYVGEDIYLWDQQNNLYRNNQQILSDVFGFYPCSDKTVIVFNETIYLFTGEGVISECNNVPQQYLTCTHHLISEKGLLYRITGKGLVRYTGWSFPMGAIDFAYGGVKVIQGQKMRSMVVVTRQNQAFLILTRNDTIVSVQSISEDITTVHGLGSHFILLTKEQTLLSVSTNITGLKMISFDINIQEGHYCSIGLIGYVLEKRYDMLAHDTRESYQLTITKDPFNITRRQLKQRYGVALELPHGTYTVVY